MLITALLMKYSEAITAKALALKHLTLYSPTMETCHWQTLED